MSEIKNRLVICEPILGGGSPDAFLEYQDGKVSKVTYEDYATQDFEWSRHEGWADGLIGYTEDEIQDWVDGYFWGFNYGDREPFMQFYHSEKF